MRVMPLGHARIGMTELGRDTRHHQARTCSTAAGYVWGLSQTLEMAAKVVGSDRTFRGKPSLKTVPIRPVLGLLTNFATGPVNDLWPAG
jgi:hypothetical protein